MESVVPKRQVLDDDDGLYESSKGRSPEKALEEIRKQDTHDLYCPKCTSNITKTALIVEKGDDFSPDDQKPFVLWIPTFKFLSSSPKGSVESKPLNPNLSGPDEENSSQPGSSEPVDKNTSFNSSLSNIETKIVLLLYTKMVQVIKVLRAHQCLSNMDVGKLLMVDGKFIVKRPANRQRIDYPLFLPPKMNEFFV
ncbi:hypothetical protein AXX17_AT4G32070 [Arabidopsis thaliana]|uniref:Uncharacterized protein n=1 Tax=Arabidopsis thaliana TaxID=3702 RepID=A0A178UXS4_ARATH|nr:hypothetical protein AXX17_AT4G32070 [Arabidopsis thaliana]